MKRINNEIISEENQLYQVNNFGINPNYPNQNYPNTTSQHPNSMQPQGNKGPNSNNQLSPNQDKLSNPIPEQPQNPQILSRFPNNNSNYPNPQYPQYQNPQYPNSQYQNPQYPNPQFQNPQYPNQIYPNSVNPNKAPESGYPFPPQNPNLNPNIFPNNQKDPNNPNNPNNPNYLGIPNHPYSINYKNYPLYNPNEPRGPNYGNPNKKRNRPKSAKGPKRGPYYPYNPYYDYEYNTEYPHRPKLNFGKPLSIINKQFRSKPKIRRQNNTNILFGKGSKGRCFACDVDCAISISGNSSNTYNPYMASLQYPRKDSTFYDYEKNGYYQYGSRLFETS